MKVNCSKNLWIFHPDLKKMNPKNKKAKINKMKILLENLNKV